MRPFRIARSRLTTCCGHGSAGARPGRRDLLAGAATSLAGLYAMMRSSSAEAQVRAFPPPPPAVSPVEGLIDFHLHSAPDVFGRAFDDEEAGIVYRDNGIEAVVMKSHVVATADRAWMWRMQGGFGRVVWFPTFDADHHVKHFKDGPEGIKVLGSDGNVLPAVREVLKICAQQKLVVCTGHLSPAESLAVARAAREAGCDRVVITHAEFEVVHLSLEEMKQAAALGAKMEICAMGPLMGPNAHLTWMRSWRQVPYKESAERIKAVGAEHFLLATDLGQTGNPSPPDGYKLLVGGLLAEGITKEQIRVMGREVPGRLLMG